MRGISEIISNTDLPYGGTPPFNTGIAYDNDWIILKLDSPLELSDNVIPACLPSENYLPDTETEARCFTSGWGRLSYGKMQWT